MAKDPRGKEGVHPVYPSALRGSGAWEGDSSINQQDCLKGKILNAPMRIHAGDSRLLKKNRDDSEGKSLQPQAFGIHKAKTTDFQVYLI